MKQASSVLTIGIAGLGVGWLVGLSTSPVVAAVIAALLAAVTGLASCSSSTELLPQRLQVAAGSVAALTTGIALGATLGLGYRTNVSWFATQPAERVAELRATVDQWVALGVPREQIVGRLLEHEWPTGPTVASLGSGASNGMPRGLVAVDADTCAELQLVAPEQILRTLAASARPELQQLGRQALELRLSDSFALRMRDALCSKERP
jgi:hypothetical protein